MRRASLAGLGVLLCLVAAVVFDLVVALFVWKLFFDGLLNNLLNRLVVIIFFEAFDYDTSVNNGLAFESVFVNQGKLCERVVVDHVSVAVAFIDSHSCLPR